MIRVVLIVIFLSLCRVANAADVETAVALLRAGEIQSAIPLFEELANEGDTQAMVTLGNLYYEGRGTAQDYQSAMNWYLRALPDNGDAFANIGVLYRDGLGVPQNLEIAYAIFVITHMRGLGSDNTQIRNGRNLQKAIAVMSENQIFRALCQSEAYVLQFVLNKGMGGVRDGSTDVPLKDREWWLDGELPDFECS